MHQSVYPANSNIFEGKLIAHDLFLRRDVVATLQVNIGKRCNQACNHCHVEAGPNRTENMEPDTINQILHLLSKSPLVRTVDITGGAPELNPLFRHFVSEIRNMGKSVIDRCNLTVLFEENQEDTAKFLAANQVQIVASLPCYTEANVNKQRGKGVFDKSIRALQNLNKLGYGNKSSGLILNLVFNPLGASLPGSQEKLEQDYKTRLHKDFDIVFNNLFTITNMPIKRFAIALEQQGKTEQYMQLLIDNFNPHAAQNVMCKELVSVGWDGKLYDCDFNQMLEISMESNNPTHIPTIWDIESFDDVPATIKTDSHCFGCTAGAGSSCTGKIV